MATNINRVILAGNSVYKYTRKNGEITLVATQTDLFGVA